MAESKKKKGKKVADITGEKELDEKDMEKVSGGMLRRPILTMRAEDDCGGNCMGSCPTSTGKDIEV